MNENKPEEKKKQGRPTDYNEEIAAIICEKLSTGLSLRTICKDEDMPSRISVFAWMRKYPSFLNQYTKAKEEAADVLMEDMMEIADDGTNDWMEINDPDNPGYRFNGEHFQRSRLRVDTRKWYLSKIKPKKYGEKIDLTSDGEKLEGNIIVFKDFSNGTESKPEV